MNFEQEPSILEVARFLQDPLILEEFHSLLLALTERETVILNDRIMNQDGKNRTLDDVGKQFGVTREMIRQVEKKMMTELIHNSAKRFPRSHECASLLTKLVGPVLPISFLGQDLVNNLTTPAGSFIRTIAGGYRINTSTDSPISAIYLKSTLNSVSKLLNMAIDNTQQQSGALATHDEVVKRLVAMGMQEWASSEIAASWPGFVRIASIVTQIPTSMDRKAHLFLQISGTPQTIESIFDFCSSYGRTNMRSLKNAVAANTEIMRVTATEFGLSIWGMERFTTLLDVMEKFITQHGETPIEILVSNLVKQYKVNANSIVFYSHLHPRFVNDNGIVRLRTTDEPVDAGRSIEFTSSCLRNAHSWTWRIQVDKELLRGSGLPIPRGLATEIGLEPNDTKVFSTKSESVTFRWKGLNPTVSTLKRFCSEFGLDINDYLFLNFDFQNLSISVEPRKYLSPTSKTNAKEALRGYLCALDGEDWISASQRAFGIQLRGQPLIDFLEMRSQATEDDTLALISHNLNLASSVDI